MGLSVRQVDVEHERGELLALLNRNLLHWPHEQRYSWAYLENPCGRAWTWVVCDGERAVGMTSVFPRAVWIGETLSTCGQVVDFAIDASYRSLGPALQLQKATFQPVEAGKLSFVYDCPPHEKGMSTFVRLGMSATAQMQRYVRLLRTEQQLRRFLRNQRLSNLIGPPGNWLLSIAAPHARRPRGLEIAEVVGEFGKEFTALDCRVGNAGGIRFSRSAEYLNWRYRRDPLRSYRCLAARLESELVGFAVFMMCGDDALGVDLFAEDLDSMGCALLDAVAECVRGQAQTLQVQAAEHDATLCSVLKHAGLRRRGNGVKIVPYAPKDSPYQSVFNAAGAWAFQFCDVMT